MSLRKTSLLITGFIAAELLILAAVVSSAWNPEMFSRLHFLTLTGIFAAITLTLITLVVILYKLFTRLNTLNISLQQVASSSDDSKIIPVTGFDEVSTLSSSINGLLARDSSNTEIVAHYTKQIQELEARQRLLEAVIDSLPDPTFAIDPDHKVILWNRAMESLTGTQKAEILGQGEAAYSSLFHDTPSHLLINLVGSDDNKLLLPNERVERKGPALYTEVYCKTQESFLWTKATPILDAGLNQIGAIESIRDVASRTQAEEQLKYLSIHDQLTGLYNRTYFTQEMDRLSAEQVAPVSIMVCDVDGLKLVNDTMGHHAGNSLLLASTEVLREALPDSAIIARIGGDEFAALLPHCDRDMLDTISARLSLTISKANAPEPEIPLSMSIGYAFSDKPFNDLSFLFKEADNNMFHEKITYNQSTQTPTVKILMKALETKDFAKEGHVDRLQSLVASVGAALGMGERRITMLRLLAKFHDIGKVGIPDRILMKQGPLTPAEVAEVQRHCEVGFRIAQTAPILVPIADGILKHHEWWNGKGYPLGLQGKEIPLDCRLLAIADAYDALTTDRPYRKAMPHEKAAAELRRRVGTQFDPELVDTFLKVIEDDNGQLKVTVLNN